MLRFDQTKTKLRINYYTFMHQKKKKYAESTRMKCEVNFTSWVLCTYLIKKTPNVKYEEKNLYQNY